MVKKWDIYFADLEPTTGSEQSGRRPVLIISNDISNKYIPVVTIIPFSSYKSDTKIYPCELFIDKKDTGLTKDSILMLQQIRSISIERLNLDKAGTIINNEVKKQIYNLIRTYFEIY